ncbi:MAG: acyl-CoA dehydrogenase family protein [Steroidobacteraceae bacterium]
MEVLDRIRSTATDIAAKHAADVDENARFPEEALAALRDANALSAAVPRELGGSGCGMRELSAHCSALAHSCSATAMILAMHHIQVACIARHGMESAFFREFMQRLVREQLLIASVTSEVGTFGDTRSSVTAVDRSGNRFTLNKDATTISYGKQADALLVTCRRAPDAPPSDQVLVLVESGQYTLDQTGNWNTLGMRGTCSPGFKLESSGGIEQILPGSYADSSAQTMVPYSHILWAALWHGIAAGAVGRASSQVRSEARKKPGTVPSSANHLARLGAQLQSVRHNWQAVAADFDALGDSERDMQSLLGIGWALKLNNLKVNVSESVVQIVHQALQIAGILGYKNDSPVSIGRYYRDVLSAALMVSNERITTKSASMLLVFKDDHSSAREDACKRP